MPFASLLGKVGGGLQKAKDFSIKDKFLGGGLLKKTPLGGGLLKRKPQASSAIPNPINIAPTQKTIAAIKKPIASRARQAAIGGARGAIQQLPQGYGSIGMSAPEAGYRPMDEVPRPNLPQQQMAMNRQRQMQQMNPQDFSGFGGFEMPQSNEEQMARMQSLPYQSIGGFGGFGARRRGMQELPFGEQTDF